MHALVTLGFIVVLLFAAAVIAAPFLDAWGR